MAKMSQRIFTLLGTAVGAGLVVFGIRRGMEWLQQKPISNPPGMQRPESAWPAERRYQPIDQPDHDPIPATGSMAAAQPMTGTTPAELVNSDTASDFDDRGTAFTISEMETTQSGSVAGDEAATSGVTAGGDHEIIMDELAAPLIEHAIAFNSVMNLLRSRQRDGEGFEGTESLTEGDRRSMRAVLNQMRKLPEDYNEAVLRKSPLAQRSYSLTRKLRDALDNIHYSGSDLFRIYGEVRKELCSLARDLDASKQVTITGLSHIRQLYECQ